MASDRTEQGRAGAAVRGGALLSVGLTLLLGGCVVAGPTYGTDKRVGEQLIEDLGSITTLRREGTVIDYKPRPGLVQPPQGAELPAPQESVARTDGAWENSPEALRKRLAEDGELRGVDTRSLAAQRAASREIDPATGKPIDMRKRAARIGPAGERRLLSDPPVSYRQAAATAPTGELGVPEYKKERVRAKARGEKDGLGSKLRRLLPF